MNYKNASKVLPKELLEQIQSFVQGEYLYIPKKEKSAKRETDFAKELKKRDAVIYRSHLEGVSNSRLAEIYNLSESSIRRILVRERKGFGSMENRISRILCDFGVENQEAKQIYTKCWQIGEDYVLKVYDDEESILRNLRVTKALFKAGVPVAKAESTADGREYAEAEGRFYLLTVKLKGSNIVRIGRNKALGEKMGSVIGDLHLAFKSVPDTYEFWQGSLLEEMKGWIRENFEKSGYKTVSKAEFDENVEALESVYESLPVQLIHRDVHFGNFLFDKGEFSGYIDFDLSQTNIRIFDLCYFLLGVLSEKEKLKFFGEEWFDFVKATLRAYDKKLTLKEEELGAVPLVMKCIELLFVSYYDSVEDTLSAESAFKTYEFIKENQRKLTLSRVKL